MSGIDHTALEWPGRPGDAATPLSHNTAANQNHTSTHTRFLPEAILLEASGFINYHDNLLPSKLNQKMYNELKAAPTRELRAGALTHEYLLCNFVSYQVYHWSVEFKKSFAGN